MKKLILTIALLLLPTVGWGQVVAEIISIDRDENKNIVAKTNYSINGVEVPSRYPKEKDKYYWVTRYSFENFYNKDGSVMTEAQIENRIKQDVDNFAKTLIIKKFTAEKNQELDLSNIVSKTFTVTTADIDISETKKLVVDTLGNYVLETKEPVVENVSK